MYRISTKYNTPKEPILHAIRSVFLSATNPSAKRKINQFKSSNAFKSVIQTNATLQLDCINIFNTTVILNRGANKSRDS